VLLDEGEHGGAREEDAARGRRLGFLLIGERVLELDLLPAHLDAGAFTDRVAHVTVLGEALAGEQRSVLDRQCAVQAIVA
jgi:hypothetical protein